VSTNPVRLAKHFRAVGSFDGAVWPARIRRRTATDLPLALSNKHLLLAR
jgi:hypothetical protein